MGLWAHNWNLVKIIYAQISILMMRSSQNFAHAMTAVLSWQVQNSDQIGSWIFILEQRQFLRDLDYEVIMS